MEGALKMRLTQSNRRALEILRDVKEMYPRQFSKAMWPDSPCWKHHTKAGPGGVMLAGGMNLAAGGYLAKLLRRGLVSLRYSSVHQPFYSISTKGRKALEEGHIS